MLMHNSVPILLVSQKHFPRGIDPVEEMFILVSLSALKVVKSLVYNGGKGITVNTRALFCTNTVMHIIGIPRSCSYTSKNALMGAGIGLSQPPP